MIRSREEEKYLEALVRLLRRQTVKESEIIIVVDYSQPETLRNLRTLEIDRVIPLHHSEFNHAYSTNLGVSASGAELVAITNGHSLPISEHWLEVGLRHFLNPKVAGVTGLHSAQHDGSAWEKFYYSPVIIELSRSKSLRRISKRVGHDWFQTTNCMIRKSLWESYPFDESLPLCEDYDWGMEMLARGYETIVDPDFSVFHSHGDGFLKFLRKQREWDRVGRVISNRSRPRYSRTRLAARKLSSETWNAT